MSIILNLLTFFTEISDGITNFLILYNVLKSRSAGGTSTYFSIFCIFSSLFQIISKHNISFNLLCQFLKLISSLILFFLLQWKFPVRSSKLKDDPKMIFLLPIALCIGLISGIYNSISSFFYYSSILLDAFSLFCQMMLTKKTRRILIFLPMTLFCIVCGQISKSMIFGYESSKTSGLNSWISWISAVLLFLSTIDFVFYILFAHHKNSEFLP